MSSPYPHPVPTTVPPYFVPEYQPPQPHLSYPGGWVGPYPPHVPQLVPYGPYGQAPPIGYQLPPLGYSTPSIAYYPRPVLLPQYDYGEERRARPSCPLDPLRSPGQQPLRNPQYDSGYDGQRTVPSDSYPSLSEYRTPRPASYDSQEECRDRGFRRQEEARRREEKEYGRQESRENQEPARGIDREPPRNMPTFGRPVSNISTIRAERPAELSISRNSLHGFDRGFARQERERRLAEPTPSSSKDIDTIDDLARTVKELRTDRGFERQQEREERERRNRQLPGTESHGTYEDQLQYRLSLLSRSASVEDVPSPERGRERERTFDVDDRNEVYARPSRISHRDTRSSSPDYWGSAENTKRGNEEWLRTMIVSVLNAYSTVSVKDRNLKMVTVLHLSKLIRSYEAGKEVKKGSRPDDFIDGTLGIKREITWLEFLREMRDDGLIRMHEVNATALKEFAIYSPFDTAVAPMADERPYTD